MAKFFRLGGVLLLAVALLSGCGGGTSTNDDDSSIGPSGVEATLDSTQSGAQASISSVDSTNTTVGAGDSASGAASTASATRVAARKAAARSLLSTPFIVIDTPIPVDDTQSGVAGTVSVVGSINLLESVLTATVTFADYVEVEGGEVMDGSLTIVLDLITDAASIHTHGLTVGVNTIVGDIDITVAGATTTLVVSVSVEDGTNTVILSDFTIVSTVNGNELTLTMDGTLTLNGSDMVVTTVVPMVTTDVTIDEHPSSGVVTFDADGIVQLTFESATTLIVEVDADEVDGFETTTGSITWDAAAILVSGGPT